MKKITLNTLAIILINISVNAQTINWKNFTNENKHLATINAGWDYASTIGLGYGYRLNTKIPIMLGGEFSSPLGNKIFDDFKTKVGLQAELFHYKNFSSSAKIYGVFRQYTSPYARLDNFGSDLSIVAGYYKSKWFVAGEFGFDKAITTHIKNSDVIKEYYPAVQDGWYTPTGGNFYYGLQAGLSFKNNDIFLNAGKTISQDFKTSAVIPLYLQLGYNFRF